MQRLRIPFVRQISAMSGGSDNLLYFVDSDRGTLNSLSLEKTENRGVLNYSACEMFKGTGALLHEGKIVRYAVKDELRTIKIYEGKTQVLRKTKFEELEDIIGIAFYKGSYFLAGKNGKVIVVDRKASKIGGWTLKANLNSMILHKDKAEEYLLFLDSDSRAVYSCNFAGKHLFSITIPYEGATALASCSSCKNNESRLFISYVHKTWEIYDDTDPETKSGNKLNLQLDRYALNVFIEPLSYSCKKIAKEGSICISGGYLAELKYYAMLLPRNDIKKDLADLRSNARISVPVNSERQKVVSIEIIGQAEGELKKDESGEDIIEFDLKARHFDKEMVILGFKATLELYNIRYLIKHSSFPKAFPPQIKKHLNIDRKLDMHRRELKEIAADILKSIPEKNRNSIIETVRAIREYVYTKLEYKYNSRYTKPLQTLKDGEGTCGKYTELLLGLMKLCRVPCRAVGDYKIPDYKLEYGVLNTVCRPDYDHVWIEFYVPEAGWVPMESSSDDLPGKHNRFFAALPWIHIESSRSAKRVEVVIPETWQQADRRYYFSDYFVHETEITVLKSLP